VAGRRICEGVGGGADARMGCVRPRWLVWMNRCHLLFQGRFPGGCNSPVLTPSLVAIPTRGFLSALAGLAACSVVGSASLSRENERKSVSG
jgi:hypothetical protein